jgi:hypothetical protein
VTGAQFEQVLAVRSDGQVMEGAWPLCWTFTVNVQVDLNWQRSSAVQVTVVTPQGKNDPDAGTHVTATVPLLSEAMGSG